jgi:hypothetical protein
MYIPENPFPPPMVQERGLALNGAVVARRQAEERAERAERELSKAKAAAARDLEAARAATAVERGPLDSSDDVERGGVPASKVQLLLHELEALQQKHDALERQVAAGQRGKQVQQMYATLRLGTNILRTPIPGNSMAGGSSQLGPHHSPFLGMQPLPELRDNSANKTIRSKGSTRSRGSSGNSGSSGSSSSSGSSGSSPEAADRPYQPERYMDGPLASTAAPSGSAGGDDGVNALLMEKVRG